MADYYTHFSCLLDVGSAANATRALALFDKGDDWDPEAERGFVVSVHPDDSGRCLWIRDEEHGDPEMVIRFVKRCAAALGLTGRWGFQYACTCSRPRLDGFGGGGHVLDLATGEMVDWISTDDWLSILLAGGDPHA